jgi:hypothetical protein
MSESDSDRDAEGFLTRWARRKEAARKAEDGVAPAAQPAPAEPPPATMPAPATEAQSKQTPADAPPDIAALPPIDTIEAASDIRAFLQTGVPDDLTRAALRRAWVADPAIRDFVGLAENAWDFTAPDGVPGFGPLAPADIARLAAYVFGSAAPEDGQNAVALQPPLQAEVDLPQVDPEGGKNESHNQTADLPQSSPVDNPFIAADATFLPQESGGDVASQNTSVPAEPRAGVAPQRKPRLHGSALPK